MLYCETCKIWVQPIQWVSPTGNGPLDLHQACPCCRQDLHHPEPAAV